MEDTQAVTTVVDASASSADIALANDFEMLPWVRHLNQVPDLAGEIGERIANRERLWNIARFYGVKRQQLMRWLKADPDRYAEYEAGLEAMADELAMDTLDEVAAATSETVGVAKLRTDTYFKFAGKLDASRWGDKAGMSVQAVGNITIIHESS